MAADGHSQKTLSACWRISTFWLWPLQNRIKELRKVLYTYYNLLSRIPFWAPRGNSSPPKIFGAFDTWKFLQRNRFIISRQSLDQKTVFLFSQGNFCCPLENLFQALQSPGSQKYKAVYIFCDTLQFPLGAQRELNPRSRFHRAELYH